MSGMEGCQSNVCAHISSGREQRIYLRKTIADHDFKKTSSVACDLLNHELQDYIKCDVHNFRQIERVFDNFGSFDYVYHLAAEYGRWNGEDHYENLWEATISLGLSTWRQNSF